ncbi:hypothetical protein GE09DRAFT_1057410 [Coniochaeta sp. 2T2.1]|nr:hypothetical protein GE09DRAFT_1057410 [Coniochaeta sp. 2T2.1]
MSHPRPRLRRTPPALRYQKRKVSPVAERLLAKHEANVVALLTGGITDADQREDLIQDITDEERVIYSKDFLRVPYKDCWPDKRHRQDREERRGNIEQSERRKVAAQAAKRSGDQEDKYKYKIAAVEEDEDAVVARNKRRHKEFEMLMKLADHNFIGTARDYVLKYLYRTIKPPLLEPAFYFEEEARR